MNNNNDQSGGLLSVEKPEPKLVVSSAWLGSEVRVFHVVGQSQYEGTCKMHLYPDCTYLVRPRTERGWDRTGAIHEDTHTLTLRNTCKVCARRAALPNKTDQT